jgi:septal ring factor EnvC (AmiA/AmiB activator)
VIPKAVTQNSSGYLLVNNDPILWTMLNAIKEQQREIRDLKAELRTTPQSLQKVKTQIAASQRAVVATK